MERVILVEDHAAFAQALELVLLFPQTARRIRLQVSAGTKS
jgi:hypothetical protein